MLTNDLIFGLGVFAAASVEAVEALTVVLAVGITRGWRSTMYGVGAALLTLAVIIAVLGPAIAAIPISVLRLVVGGLLLIFGLGWLRKAILRAVGYLRTRDEAAIFTKTTQAAGDTKSRRLHAVDDWYSFTVSYKSVLLEGLEVVFIVLAFATSASSLSVAVIASLLAIIVIAALGIALRRPLTKIPENALKYGVGVMLTSFGTFWAAEGAGIHWPAGDASLPVLILSFAVAALLIQVLARRYYRASLVHA
jgi:uncharacterized membrane protein